MLWYLWLLLFVVFGSSYGDHFTAKVDDLLWAEIESEFLQPSKTRDLIKTLRDCLNFSNETTNGLAKYSHNCEIAALSLESRHVNQLKHGQRDRPLKVDAIPAVSAYFSVFEDYIINNRIFQSEFKEAVLASSLKEINKAAIPYFPWLSKLVLPSELAQQLMLPAIASNSYIRRLNETVVFSLETIAFDGFPCYGHVCLVHSNHGAEGTPYFQCPAGGNMLLWSLDAKTENVKITIAETKKLQEDVIISPDQVVRSLRMRHVFLYEQSQDTPSTTRLLSTQQLLFIPRPFAISVHNPSQANIAVFCVLDASNLNTMRVEVRSVALAGSSVHRQIYHHLTHPSLLDTQSLVRHPAVLSLQSFYNKSAAAAAVPETTTTEDNTAKANKNDRRNRRQKGDFKSWQETAAWRSFLGGLTLPPPPCPSFRSIQREDIALTFSLPLATLPPEADRTAFGFELTMCKTSAVASRGVLLAGTNLAISLSTSAEIAEDLPNIATCEMEETRVYLLGNASLHLSVTTVVREAGDEEIANFVLHVSSLAAAMRYQFSLRLRYGTAMQGVQRGPLSPYTPMVTTYPLTVPSIPRPVLAHLLEVDTIRSSVVAAASVESVNNREWWRDEEEGSVVIRFRAPEDNGGRPILGYWVFMRVANSNFPTSYRSLGAFPARLSTLHTVFEIILSRRMLPLTLPLEFRIAAASEVGVSHWSSPTSPIALSAVPFTSTESAGKETSGSNEKKTRVLSLLWGNGYSASKGALSETLPPLPSTYLANKNLEGLSQHSGDDDQAALLLLSLPHQLLTVIQSNPLPFRPPPLILSTPPKAASASYEVWASHWVHPELVDPDYGLVILAATCDLYLPSPLEMQGHAEIEIKSYEEQITAEKLEQRQRCQNRIAFVPRGHLNKPMFELALLAQQAGVLAAIVVDPVDGRCAGGRYDQKCVPGASKKHREGFAMQDLANLWSAVKIPVLLASYDVAQAVRKNLDNILADDKRKKIEQNEVIVQQASGSEEL